MNAPVIPENVAELIRKDPITAEDIVNTQSTSQPCPTPCEGECECKGPAVAPASGKKSVKSYYLKVKGVFGRNRKVKFEVFTVIKDIGPNDKLSMHELDGIAKGILEDEVKLKSGVAILSEQPEEVEDYAIGDTGYTTRCFSLFSDRQVWKLTRAVGADDVLTIGGEK